MYINGYYLFSHNRLHSSSSALIAHPAMNETHKKDKVRLDKWLWATRFFKTRPLATEAIIGGKVHVNGERVRPGKVLCIGDELSIRRGRNLYVVIVRGLTGRRGPASQTPLLYEETEESRQNRTEIGEQQRLYGGLHAQQKGRPNKRNRRTIIRYLRRRG
jgi:ribosome-associated heat shock protein Hsp15